MARYMNRHLVYSFVTVGRCPAYSGPQQWDLMLVKSACPGMRGELLDVCCERRVGWRKARVGVNSLSVNSKMRPLKAWIVNGQWTEQIPSVSAEALEALVRPLVHPDRSCYHYISWKAWAISMKLNREYSPAHTDDLIRFWRSKVKVMTVCVEGIHADTRSSKSIF